MSAVYQRKPIVVLVRPQLGENIGKARAPCSISACRDAAGRTTRRMAQPSVARPRPGPTSSSTGRRAFQYGQSRGRLRACLRHHRAQARRHQAGRHTRGSEPEIAGAQGRSAILFGPERSGLETEDVALARAILTVPINPEFGSLNLAQAVILCAYEWSKHEHLVQPTQEELLPPAPQEDLDGLIGHLEGMLEPKGYFLPAARAEATRRTLRGVLTKPGWNHLEVRTLRGVLSSLGRGPKP